MMGDPSKLLTHYHDDARTMYEVFQRGLHISGGWDVASVPSGHTAFSPLFDKMAHKCKINSESVT